MNKGICGIIILAMALLLSVYNRDVVSNPVLLIVCVVMAIAGVLLQWSYYSNKSTY